MGINRRFGIQASGQGNSPNGGQTRRDNVDHELVTLHQELQELREMIRSIKESILELNFLVGQHHAAIEHLEKIINEK